MKRFFGFAFAMFFAVASIALVGGESTAVAGRGCHGARRCHGARGGLLHRHRRCHGHATPVADDCGACGEVVAGGCAGGDCGGGDVIVTEGVPTEASPAPKTEENKAKAEPAKT